MSSKVKITKKVDPGKRIRFMWEEGDVVIVSEAKKVEKE